MVAAAEATLAAQNPLLIPVIMARTTEATTAETTAEVMLRLRAVRTERWFKPLVSLMQILALDPAVIATGFANNGQSKPEPGRS
jgi:hypothetical protein